ncbi:unnamed protein product [Phytophthora fragariaefolia]|uniref:Unnamed protein product n=1 Tax=Phytophthora fragariaefolia TaxID=1490495 RepID=A0A9W6Y201_9STRA|nr:unnamed protein product [Phytophthora fragariaefolia]
MTTLKIHSSIIALLVVIRVATKDLAPTSVYEANLVLQLGRDGLVIPPALMPDLVAGAGAAMLQAACLVAQGDVPSLGLRARRAGVARLKAAGTRTGVCRTNFAQPLTSL